MKAWLIGLLVSSALTATITYAVEAEEKGKAVYDKWCSHCHGPEHKENPGTIALKAKYQGNLPADLLERQDITEKFISFYVRNGISVMPIFRKTEISDKELKSLTSFIVSKGSE